MLKQEQKQFAEILEKESLEQEKAKEALDIAGFKEAVNQTLKNINQNITEFGKTKDLELLPSKEKLEIGNIQEQAKTEAQKAKEQIEAYACLADVFNTLENLKNKDIEDTNIKRDHLAYLEQIEKELAFLAFPEYVGQEEQLSLSEMNQALTEQANHIISKKDEQEITQDFALYQTIHSKAQEKMGQANREIDTIERIRKKKRQAEEHKVPELQKQAKQHEQIIKLTESHLEYQESLLEERTQIEELIQIGAITEQEIETIKQAFNQASEKIDQLTPKETKEQAEANAKAIKELIETKFSKQDSGYKRVLEKYVNLVRRLAPEDSSKLRKGLVKALEIGGAIAGIIMVGHFVEGFLGAGEAEAAEQPPESFDLQKEYPNLKEHIESGKLTLEETQALLREGFEDVEENQLNIGDPDNPKIAEILLRSVIKQEYGIENIDIAKLPPNIQKFIQNESVNEFVEDALEDDLKETKEFIENNPEMKAWFEKTTNDFKKALNNFKDESEKDLGLKIDLEKLKSKKEQLERDKKEYDHMSELSKTREERGEKPYGFLTNMQKGIKQLEEEIEKIEHKDKNDIVSILSNTREEGENRIFIQNIDKISQEADRIILAMCTSIDIADNPAMVEKVNFFQKEFRFPHITLSSATENFAGAAFSLTPTSVDMIKDDSGKTYLKYREREQKENFNLIALNPTYVQDLPSLRGVLIHELNHVIYQERTGSRVKYYDYTQSFEPTTEILKQKTLRYLNIKPNIDEQLRRNSDKQLKISRVPYAENISKIGIIQEIVHSEWVKVYVGAETPEKFVKMMPETFQAWGINKDDAEKLSRNLVNFNSIHNPDTAKIVDEWVAENSIALNEITERDTGDLILINSEQEKELENKILTSYYELIEDILQRNDLDNKKCYQRPFC